MHESLRLLDIAMDVLGRELNAVEEEDDELLERLCGEREVLMRRAWELRGGCDARALEEKLHLLQRAQKDLSYRAGLLTERVRGSLRENRRQSAGLSGYRKAGIPAHGFRFLKSSFMV
jgi:hypothetical protein